jgi:hypothetical protein
MPRPASHSCHDLGAAPATGSGSASGRPGTITQTVTGMMTARACRCRRADNIRGCRDRPLALTVGGDLHVVGEDNRTVDELGTVDGLELAHGLG